MSVNILLYYTIIMASMTDCLQTRETCDAEITNDTIVMLSLPKFSVLKEKLYAQKTMSAEKLDAQKTMLAEKRAARTLKHDRILNCLQNRQRKKKAARSERYQQRNVNKQNEREKLQKYNSPKQVALRKQVARNAAQVAAQVAAQNAARNAAQNAAQVAAQVAAQNAAQVAAQNAAQNAADNHRWRLEDNLLRQSSWC
jgi:membrane protein involved in colicin uptake